MVLWFHHYGFCLLINLIFCYALLLFKESLKRLPSPLSYVVFTVLQAGYCSKKDYMETLVSEILIFQVKTKQKRFVKRWNWEKRCHSNTQAKITQRISWGSISPSVEFGQLLHDFTAACNDKKHAGDLRDSWSTTSASERLHSHESSWTISVSSSTQNSNLVLRTAASASSCQKFCSEIILQLSKRIFTFSQWRRGELYWTLRGRSQIHPASRLRDQCRCDLLCCSTKKRSWTSSPHFT